MAKYECNKCHYLFDEQTAGESFDNLYSCPICDAGKECFILIEGDAEKTEVNNDDDSDKEFTFEEAEENEATEESTDEYQIFDEPSEDKEDKKEDASFEEVKEEASFEDTKEDTFFENVKDENSVDEAQEEKTANYDNLFRVADSFSDTEAEERKAKEEEDKKLYEAIFGRPYEANNANDNASEEADKVELQSNVSVNETSANESEVQVKDFIDELLSEKEEVKENNDAEENKGFVIEKRQEFWKKEDETKPSDEEKAENVPFSINHTGSVFKVIGADSEYEESHEKEAQSTPNGNGLIQTFYTGNSVKSEEELKAEEESKNKDNSQEFRPFFGSGMGTIQRVLGAPGAKADSEEEFVFEDSKEDDGESVTEEASVEETVLEEVVTEEAPVEAVATEEAVEETAFEEAVNEETPVEENSFEDTVIEDVTDESATFAEEVIEDAPAGDAIFEETVIEDATLSEENEEVLVTEDAGENIDDGFEEDDGFFFEEADETDEFVGENDATFGETVEVTAEDVEEYSEPEEVFEDITFETEESVVLNEGEEISGETTENEEVVEEVTENEEVVEEENEEVTENEDEGVVFLNFDEEPASYIVEDDAESESVFEANDDEAEVIDFGETTGEEVEEVEEPHFENTETLDEDEAEELNFDDEDEIEDDAEYIDLGQVYMEEQAEKEAKESDSTEETQIAYSMLKSDMKYTVLYDNEAKKIFDDYPVVNENVSNGLENIILLPAQCNPLPLDRRANVETKTVIGALTACPVEVSQPFCFSKLFIWGEHIPNNSRPEEYTNQALVLVKGEEGHIPNLAGKEELREEVAIAKARFHGTPVGLDLVVGRIEADLEACVYAKADFVILNDVSSRILPYALRRARNYLNRVNSKLEILVCVEALKDAQELAKILALGANFVLVESGFDLEMAGEMTEALKEICRSTGHTNVHDLNLEDICTIDTDLAMFTDISHV